MSAPESAHRPELMARRVRMAAVATAAGEARAHVRAAIHAWQLAVDLDAAELLTSELITNAIAVAADGLVMLSIRFTFSCSGGRLRIEVHDSSPDLPFVARGAADAETGRGLMLVHALAANWGSYRTPAGKAVYFTLPASVIHVVTNRDVVVTMSSVLHEKNSSPLRGPVPFPGGHLGRRLLGAGR